jgi:hypothetical protein
MEWQLVAGNQVEARVSAAETDSSELLGDLLSMWTRDRHLHDWEDRDRMAQVAVEYSDLDQVEIWAIFGIDPGDPPSVSPPPWSFSHPSKDGTITLCSEE